MKQALLLAISLFAFYPTQAKEATKVVDLQVTQKGFEPNEIKVNAGTKVTLKITRKTDATCATKVHFKDQKITKDLPLNKEVSIDLGTLKKGDVRFACGMDMISGHIIAE